MFSRKNKNLFDSKFTNKKQRFTLKKTKQVGVVSVLIGALFFIYNTENVSADSYNSVINNVDITSKGNATPDSPLDSEGVPQQNTDVTEKEDTKINNLDSNDGSTNVNTADFRTDFSKERVVPNDNENESINKVDDEEVKVISNIANNNSNYNTSIQQSNNMNDTSQSNQKDIEQGNTFRSTNVENYVGKQITPSKIDISADPSAIGSPPTLSTGSVHVNMEFSGGLHAGDYFYFETQDSPIQLPNKFIVDTNGEHKKIADVERIDFISDYYKGQDINDPSRFNLSAKNGYITKGYKYKVVFNSNVENLTTIRATFTESLSNQTLATAINGSQTMKVAINDKVVFEKKYVQPSFNDGIGTSFSQQIAANGYPANKYVQNDGTKEFIKINSMIYDMRPLGDRDEVEFYKDVKTDGIMTFNAQIGGLPNGFKVIMSVANKNKNPYTWSNYNMVGAKLPVYYFRYNDGNISLANSNDGSVYVTPDDHYMIIDSISDDMTTMTVSFYGDYSKPGIIINGTLNPDREPKDKSSKFSVDFNDGFWNGNTTSGSDVVTNFIVTKLDGSLIKGQSYLGGSYRYPDSSKFSALSFEEINGSVVVNYKDEEGNEIKTSVDALTDVSTGADYNVDTDEFKPQTITDKDGRTYELVPEKTEGNPTGKVTKGTTEITYVYREVKGSVVVNYKDEEGNEIKTSVDALTDVSTGADYNVDTDEFKPQTITDKDGRTYELVPEKTEGNPTGKVTKGTTEITYVYREVKGSVVVNYKDEEGNEIKTSVDALTDVSTGADYNVDTDEFKPQTITDKDGRTYELVPEKTEGNPTGKVTKGTTEITYVYREVKGSVVVNYKDEEGNEIKTSVDALTDVSTGADYNVDTDEFKPQTITDKDGRTYELVPEKTEGNPTGKVTKGTTEITYVYREVKGSVVVNYKDEEGNEIKTSVDALTDVSTGADYNVDTDEFKPQTITDKDGRTYELVPEKTEGNPTGKVTKGTTEITYVYREVKGSVVVNYKDEEGNEIKTSVDALTDVSTGADYNVDTDEFKPQTITDKDGRTYELVPEKTEGNPTGKVTKGTTEITYVYREVKGSVVVNYKDEEGNEIKTSVDALTDVSTGADYNVDTDEFKPQTITDKDGRTYELVPEKTEGNPTGKVTKGTTEITYVYREVKGSVVVNYKDEEGNEIKTSVDALTDVSTGADYNVDTDEFKPQTITDKDGRTYELVPEKTEGNPTGKVTKGTTEITYVYREVKGSVVVNYKDEEGNEIKTSVDALTDVSTGADYNVDTDEFKPQTITDKDGRTYELVPEKTEGNPTGKVTKGTTEITYVYREVKGSVVVNYKDEEGNEIKTSVDALTDVSTGADYNVDTDEFKPQTITDKDGRTYELVPEKTEGNPTGKVTKGTTEITYVYREVKGSVVVNYKDEEGNEIKTSVDALTDVSTGADYNVDTDEFKPQTITDKDGRTYELVPEKTEGNPTGKVTKG
ncbi:MucBP domain-containing protein, partial [Lactobacillus sp. AN1001]